MAEKSGLFNSSAEVPRRYKDEDFADMMSLFVGQSGYVSNYLGELEVVDNGSSDRKVKILPGGAWLGYDAPGWWYINDGAEELILQLPNPGAGVTEDYAVVIELDRGDDLSAIASYVEYTSISQNSTLYQLPLAKVTVSGDTTDITVSDVRVPCVRSASGICEKSANFTLSFSDTNMFIKCVNTEDIVVTVPADESEPLPINTEVVICQFDATYTVSVSPEPDSEVVVHSIEGNLKSDGQYSAFTLRKIGANEWIAVGALSS